jgi:multiple sugar transport system permease protein
MNKQRGGLVGFRANGGWAPYVFLSPTLLLFIAIFMFPIIYVIWSSMFSWNLMKPYEGKIFVGFKNFTDLLSDSSFWDSIWITAKFVLLSVPLEVVLGMLLAVLLNRPFRGKKWIQSIILTPMMAAPIAIFLSWRFLLEPTFGIVNYLLSRIGITGPGWFADPKTALISVVIVDIWQMVPFIFLVLFAALQTVPQDPLESAQVDGATPLQTFWHVTLPSIKPVLLVVAIIRIMDAIRAFDNIYVLTNGGPANATRTVQFLDYEASFVLFDVGKGSALALIIVAMILLVGSLMIREMNRTNDELK